VLTMLAMNPSTPPAIEVASGATPGVTLVAVVCLDPNDAGSALPLGHLVSRRQLGPGHRDARHGQPP
jgi:hypothetical protein